VEVLRAVRQRKWWGTCALGVLVALAGAPHAHAATAASFVPDGYYIEYRASSDVNNDGRSDQVLIVRKRKAPIFNGTPDRVVLVLRQLAEGGFLPTGSGRRAAMCTTCARVLYDGKVPPVVLKAVSGGFTIAQSYIGDLATTYHQVLQFAGRGGGIRMITIRQRRVNTLTGDEVSHVYYLERGEHQRRTIQAGLPPSSWVTEQLPLRSVGLANVSYKDPLKYALYDREPKRTAAGGAPIRGAARGRPRRGRAAQRPR